MKVLADYVLPGETAADIGTDHGFVPIHLLAENICPFVIMTDINEGPLVKAEGNLDYVGIDERFYNLRHGNGLEVLKPYEAASVIIAGMGGENIIEILEADIPKTKSYRRLILHPRKRAWMLRRWLYENGFASEAEKLVDEAGKYCEIIVARPLEDGEKSAEITDENLFFLPEALRDDALFDEFLKDYIRKLNIVIDNMGNSETQDIEEIKAPWIRRREYARSLLR